MSTILEFVYQLMKVRQSESSQAVARPCKIEKLDTDAVIEAKLS